MNHADGLFTLYATIRPCNSLSPAFLSPSWFNGTIWVADLESNNCNKPFTPLTKCKENFASCAFQHRRSLHYFVFEGLNKYAIYTRKTYWDKQNTKSAACLFMSTPIFSEFLRITLLGFSKCVYAIDYISIIRDKYQFVDISKYRKSWRETRVKTLKCINIRYPLRVYQQCQ